MPKFIIEYPEPIQLPFTETVYAGKESKSILYSRLVKFNIEDEKSKVNWYFSYKRDMKKVVIFKEYTAVKEIVKHEIPTARNLQNGTADFIKKLAEIGITATIGGDQWAMK